MTSTACIQDVNQTWRVLQAVGTFEGLLEEVTQYNESERLLADPTVASGDMAIAEGLTFTNKAASSLHWASVKVRWSCRDATFAGSAIDSRPLQHCSLTRAKLEGVRTCRSLPVKFLLSTAAHGPCRQVAGGILMGADAMSKRMTDHAAKVQASSEPGAPRPVPGAITASASMTRAGTKVLSKTAGKVGRAGRALHRMRLVDESLQLWQDFQPASRYDKLLYRMSCRL